tara:strand:- start:222 stop:1769 length:1548 start_codon:yes stop_codon:yes gene_type:complete
MSLLRSSAIIGLCTLLSRIFGFVRDILIASTLGASWFSDAFFVAFKLPNFFRRLFAEGAFNAAFVPQFAGKLETEGHKEAISFASQALSVLLAVLLVLNALFLVFMPVFLRFFAPGFSEDADKYALTVELARICFPYILTISLVSLLAGILQSLGRFVAASMAPVLLNFSLIAAVLLTKGEPEAVAFGLSWGVFAAGFIQLAWLLWFAHRADALPTLRLPRLTPPVKKLMWIMAPAALGAGVAQVNLLVDVVLASLFPEGVSYLYYADRLNELPIGVIGVAVGTALLPSLSKQIKAGNQAGAAHSLNRAIELVLLLGLPCAVALMLIPEALVRVLYEHGAFSPQDRVATYTALMAYSAGLPAFLLVKVFAPGFFAAEDTKTPFKIALVCVGINLGLNLILMQYFEHVGLAMATSVASWVNVAAMAVILHRRGQFQPTPALWRHLGKQLLNVLVMGGVLALCLKPLAPWLEGDTQEEIIGLTLLISAGLISFILGCVLLRVIDPADMKLLLRQKQR